MSKSLDLQIVEAIATAIRSTAIVPNDSVFVGRVMSESELHLPAFDVFPDAVSIARLGGQGKFGVAGHESRFVVRFMMRDNENQFLVNADPYWRAAYAAVMADETLGGLVAGIQPTSREYYYDLREGRLPAVAMIYNIQFATRYTDVTVKAG